MTAALDLDVVRLTVARLETELDRDAWPTVEQVLTLGDSMPAKIPAVVVGLLADDYDEGVAPGTGNYQRAQAVLGVWHVIECRNTPRGAGGPAVDPLARFVGATREALQAWLPPGVHRSTTNPLRLRRGLLDRIANARAVWRDEYVFSWRPVGRRAHE